MKLAILVAVCTCIFDGAVAAKVQYGGAAYNGVAIKSDKSIVQMGKNGDVNLVRVGPKKLKVSADVSVDGKLNVKGMSFKAMADRIAALEKKVADNDKHTRAAISGVFDSLKCSGFGTWDFDKEKCKCDKDKAGADCSVDPASLPKGQGKSPCQAMFESGIDTKDGLKTIVVNGKKHSFFCKGGWMLVFSVGCLRNAVQNNIWTQRGQIPKATGCGDVTDYLKTGSCKFSDDFINKAVGSRGYRVRVYGSKGGKGRPFRYVSSKCKFVYGPARSNKLGGREHVPADCRVSWSNLKHTQGRTEGAHYASYGMELNFPDCGAVLPGYHKKTKTFLTCGNHCEDKPCHEKGPGGCNLNIWV